MPHLQLNGEQIYYALHHNESDGVPVLLLHGAGESHLVWPIGLRRLPGTIVYAIDLPGHGKSSGSSCASIEDYADWLLAFMGAAHIDRAILIGHSMGGAIAQLGALKYPDRVVGLVLVATAARLRVAPQLVQSAESDFAAAVEFVTQWVWGPFVSEEVKQLSRQQLLTVRPESLLADYLACDAFDVRARLTEIKRPTLIIAGEADRMTPLKQATFLAEQIPQARLVVIPRAGHMVMLETASAVTQAVTDFVRENTSP